MDSVTRIMVNKRYLPSNGMASDVGGIISASSKKNTVNDRRIEEHSETCWSTCAVIKAVRMK